MPQSPSPAVGLRVLGPLEIRRLADGIRVASSPRRAALLAYLAIAEPRGPHARDVLLALLWPESDTSHGRRSLRNTLHELRQELGADVIETVGKHQLRLVRELVQCDLYDLEQRLSRNDLHGALAGYGDLMDGFHVRDAEGFERWHDGARDSLRTRVLGLARRSASTLLTADPATALELLRSARRIDPDDETLLRLELEALGRLGDIGAAQRSYRAYRERLARDGTGTPDPETTSLLERLVGGRGAVDSLTVALIPLETATSRPEDAEYARALDDGLRRRLTRLAGVRVVAPSSVLAALHSGASLPALGRGCGADLVASGRLNAPSSDEIEVRVEVLRATDGTIVREFQHRARRHDLFALEGVIAAAVVPAPSHLGPDRDLPEPQRPHSTEVYLLCLRGQWHFLRAAHVGGRPEDLERSRACFEEALASDPRSGAAYAGLSNYWAVCAARGIRHPFEDTFAQAIALSHRALELDASLAVPHVHFGVRALYLERDWPTARSEFTEATRLDPGYAEAHRFLGIVRRALGDGAGGLAALQEAVRLEPQVPHFRNSLADALLADGALDAARAQLEVALQLDPHFRAAAERLVRCHERAARWEQAIEARNLLGAPDAALRFAKAFCEASAQGYLRERRLELETQIAALTARIESGAPSPADRFTPPELTLALACAELGEWEHAWHWESAASSRGLGPWFASHPMLSPLAPRRTRKPGA